METKKKAGKGFLSLWCIWRGWHSLEFLALSFSLGCEVDLGHRWRFRTIERSDVTTRRGSALLACIYNCISWCLGN